MASRESIISIFIVVIAWHHDREGYKHQARTEEYSVAIVPFYIGKTVAEGDKSSLVVRTCSHEIFPCSEGCRGCLVSKRFLDFLSLQPFTDKMESRDGKDSADEMIMF